MNRAHWQALAEERLLAAQALLAAQHWSAAYYLAGYAVEFGLKSCILVHIEKSGVIFKEKKFSDQCWTHNVYELVCLAGLEDQLDADGLANPLFGDHWLTVKRWKETSRYHQQAQVEAEELYNAITDNQNGVMPWIRSRW